MGVFVTLYDLALSILTAPADNPLHELTSHHADTPQQAKEILQAAILQRTMPGEEPGTPWGILRVFMRNLVNRAHPAIDPNEMLRQLDLIEKEAQTFRERCDLLFASLADNPRLTCSLAAFLDPCRALGNAPNYMVWLTGRLTAYGNEPVGEIDPKVVLCDLKTIATRRDTKIPNMGIPLAANLLADLGVRAVAKPDLHVKPTINGLFRNQCRNNECIIEKVIDLAKHESLVMQAMPRFNWLTGGLYPRDIDRIIYLIGSDNFCLNGHRNRRHAPCRRLLMRANLQEQP